MGSVCGIVKYMPDRGKPNIRTTKGNLSVSIEYINWIELNEFLGKRFNLCRIRPEYSNYNLATLVSSVIRSISFHDWLCKKSYETFVAFV